MNATPVSTTSAEQALDAIPRVRLADLPTPLDEAPRLARHLNLASLRIKRDDQTGLAGGGNKARKLEYDFAEILRLGCDVVVTVGGAQSNHARMTAAAARKLGLDVKLVLGGPDVEGFPGNMLLDALFGAEIRFLRNNDNNTDLTEAMITWVNELRAAGRNPYAIPVGGSTGLGALGYVRAMHELAGQVGDAPLQIVLAVGSCGTLAGVLLGARLFLPRARIVGISVSRTRPQIAEQTLVIIKESQRLLRLNLPFAASDVEVYDEYYGEYGVSTESGKDAILTAARLEGLILDPIYTGKTMAGLMDLARRDILDRSRPVVFLHTGGLPILFSFENTFRDATRLTKM